MLVKFFAYLRDYTNTKEVTIVGCETVRELMQVLCRRYGKKFEEKVFPGSELGSEVILLLNGRHIAHYDGLDTKLRSEDEICVFPVVAGG